MNINQPQESEQRIRKGLPFVKVQDVAAGDPHTAAVEVQCPEDYVIAIKKGSLFAPEFRDAQGEKLDPATNVTVQKADKQGNLIGNAIAFDDTLDVFDYEKMRSDEDYMVGLNKSILLDEREYLRIFVDIPNGSDGFDAGNSRVTIGDNATDLTPPIFIRSKSNMSSRQASAVKQASQSQR